MSDMIITLTLNAAGLKKGVDEAKAKLGTLPKEQKTELKADTASLGQSIGKVRSLYAAAAAAILTVGAVIRGSIKEAIEAEQGFSKVAQAVKSTGGAAGMTAEQLKALADSLEQATAIDGDEIMNNITLPLLTFTKISTNEMPRAQMAVLNMSRALDIDMKGAALQVGKALQDPTIGLTALRRSGVSFSEDQMKVIKALYETGEAAKAQQLILEELDKEFGGQAEKYATTYAGKLQAFSVAWGNLKEQIGGGLLPVLSAASTWFTKLVEGVNGHKSSLEAEKESIIGQRVEFERLVLVYKDLHLNQNRSKEQNEQYAKAINDLMTKYPNYLGKVDLERGKWSEISGAIGKAREQLQLYINMKIQEAVVKDMEAQIVSISQKIVNTQSKLYTLQAEFEAGTKSRTQMVPGVANPLGGGGQGVNYVPAPSGEAREEDRLIGKVKELTGEQEKLTRVMQQRLKIAQSIYAVEPGGPVGTGGSAGGGDDVTAQSGASESANTKTVAATQNTYQKLLEIMAGYHREAEQASLSHYDRELDELQLKMTEEEAMIQEAADQKLIGQEEADAMKLELERIYADKFSEVLNKEIADRDETQRKADADGLKAQAEALESKLRDQESYYESMKFIDAGYYEWRKSQLAAQVAAMDLSEGDKGSLLAKLIAELDAEKAAYAATQSGQGGGGASKSWFFSDVLGYDPDNPADQARVEAIKSTYSTISQGAQSMVSGLLNLTRQRKQEELDTIEGTAAKEKWSQERLLAEKTKINARYAAEERKLRNVQKTLSIATAIINVAEGVTKALAMGPVIGPIMAAIISAMGAVHIGIISAQKFAQGGLFRGKGGPQDDQNIVALSDGEYIVNAAATKRNKGLLDAINFGILNAPVIPRLAYAGGGQVSTLAVAPMIGHIAKSVDALGDKIEILNLNLVKKQMSITVQNRIDGDSVVRTTDISRNRMEKRGYVPDLS